MLISPEYQEQQREMHGNPNYGMASVQYAPMVAELIDMGAREILDYGCGKGRLGETLRQIREDTGKPEHAFRLYQYDPGIEGLDEPPEPAELVCCIDVLEHVEPDCLDDVLDDLRRVTKRMGFFTIHTGPAQKTLPDGRNAHLIQADFRFWLPKLWDRFEVATMTHTDNGFYVICH